MGAECCSPPARVPILPASLTVIGRTLSLAQSRPLFEGQNKSTQLRDFPGGPVAKTALSMQGFQVRSLVRELNPTCYSYDMAQPNK